MDTNPFADMARNWWVLMIYGVAAVVFGIIALMSPLAAAAAIAWAIGLLALIEGITSVAALFSNNVAVSKGWLALYAALSIMFGLVAIINPLLTAGALLIFFAVWLIVAGIYRILFAIRVRKHIQGEWLIILSGALAIILGILFIAMPVVGMAVTAVWIGAFVLIYGVLQIVAGWRLHKMNRAIGSQ